MRTFIAALILISSTSVFASNSVINCKENKKPSVFEVYPFRYNVQITEVGTKAPGEVLDYETKAIVKINLFQKNKLLESTTVRTVAVRSGLSYRIDAFRTDGVAFTLFMDEMENARFEYIDNYTGKIKKVRMECAVRN